MDYKFEYLSQLLDTEITCKEDVEKYGNKVKKALRKAWEIRNFEINLYWKRALYFWGFIVLAFSGVVAILNLKQDIFAVPFLNKYLFLTINCLWGTFLSFGWYLSNRGAKYFQTNWEKWINYLEEFDYGKLYSNPIEPTEMKVGWFSIGKFSLSRINIIFSFAITMLWFGMTILFSYFILPNHSTCVAIITTLTMIILGIVFYLEVKSDK